jgi:hypothetical protein
LKEEQGKISMIEESLRKEINETLKESGVHCGPEITIVIISHVNDSAFDKRLDLFCQLFVHQFAKVYPDACIHWQKISLPLEQEEDLPHLAQENLCLLLLSVDCLLALHQHSALYTALVNHPGVMGIVAHATPVGNEKIRFTALFPPVDNSLALCVDEDEIYSDLMEKVWAWARNICRL